MEFIEAQKDKQDQLTNALNITRNQLTQADMEYKATVAQIKTETQDVLLKQEKENADLIEMVQRLTEQIDESQKLLVAQQNLILSLEPKVSQLMQQGAAHNNKLNALYQTTT